MAKRARSANLTETEKVLLTDLCLKFESVIESKRTDAVSRKTKEEAWQTLAAEFNAATTAAIHREPGQLKHVSDTLVLRIESRTCAGLLLLMGTGEMRLVRPPASS